MNSLIGKSINYIIPRLLGTFRKQHLSILIYHRVLPLCDSMRPYDLTAEDFEWQMALISKYFTVLSLSDALDLMSKSELPRNSICVTFDDGYADNATVALPILEKWSIPATVFISTGFINGGRMWNDTVIESFRRLEGNCTLEAIGLGRYVIDKIEDRINSALDVITKIKHWDIDKRSDAVQYIESLCPSSLPLPTDLMLTDKQILKLADAHIEIGGHTVNHPILSTLEEDQAIEEIKQGKNKLEKIIGKRLRFFAYPNGKVNQDFLPEQCQLVKDLGFDAAVTTERGVSSLATDKFKLARFTPWDTTPTRFLLRLLLNQKVLI
jgi:peptidoglycan/xylan/chitin deacetylase (PgdA/CDA1 family)